MEMEMVGVFALGARRELPWKKKQNTANGMVHTAGGIAVRRGAEIIKGGSGLLSPDYSVYYFFEVGKSIHVLRPRGVRRERETRVRQNGSQQTFYGAAP